MNMKLKRSETIKSYQEELVQWRKEFHRHPELGFEEVWTSKRIVEILSDLDVDIEQGVCSTAVVAVIKGEQPGPVIGVRADMDALAMEDLKEVDYKSENPGVCHACGHDVHVTIALGVAKYYSSHKNELKGTLKLVFQPAEEGPTPGGGKLVVESGVIDDVDKMLCLHTNPDWPTGTVLLRKGEMLASADNFNVEIKGRGGHGAYPHQTIDPISVAIEIYQALQLMMTREIDPVKATALSICYINGGSEHANNVVPETASIGGTIRSFDNDIRDLALKRLEEIVEGICKYHECTFEMKMAPLSIALKNDEELICMLDEAGTEIVGREHVKYMEVPEMGCDDFAYYGLKSKAAYFYFGTTKAEDLGTFTFHHPKFDVDENSLCLGVEMMVRAIEKCAN